jgi:ankyrin repeat protein
LPAFLQLTGSISILTANSIERQELVKLITFLIEEGAEVSAVDDGGFSSFIYCARNGEIALCKFLVVQGADPSLYGGRGTALHEAACSDRVDIFRYLVEDCGLKIDAEWKDDKMRQITPLAVAALKGSVEVCKYLLKAGAKVDAGYQPLLIAAQVQIIRF